MDFLLNPSLFYHKARPRFKEASLFSFVFLFFDFTQQYVSRSLFKFTKRTQLQQFGLTPSHQQRHKQAPCKDEQGHRPIVHGKQERPPQIRMIPKQ